MRSRILPVLVFFVFCINPVTADDAPSGETIAKQGIKGGTAPCSGCHGASGEGNAAANFPRLAGLNAQYLAAQINAYKDGERSSPIMKPVADGLSDAEVEAVASYYSGLSAPSAATPIQGADLELGKQLAELGSWQDRELPACNQCHGPQGKGVGAVFPAIDAQPAGYVVEQLKAWRVGQRKTDLDGLMKSVATKLNDKESGAVASYYALLGSDPDKAAKLKASDPASPPEGFASPARSEIPDGDFGASISRGEQIFLGTDTHAVSAPYVGNHQQCADCHLDAGRLADSSPMWAAWVSYPAYRKKNEKVNTFIERIQGCFTYSMNAQGSKRGQVPAADSEPIVDLTSYFYWLATSAPTGDHKMSGRGYPAVTATASGFDPERGRKVYDAHCAVCHGPEGNGTRAHGEMVFPPLWGDGAYNWGAGMHRIDTATAFIQHNMPLGQPNLLSDQESWDVAAFVNSHPRPQDPRYDGNFKETVKRFHSGKYDYYGKIKLPDGKRLGEP